MKALLTLAVLTSFMFSNKALAEIDTYCGRFPTSSVCAGLTIAPPNFGPFSAETDSAPTYIASNASVNNSVVSNPVSVSSPVQHETSIEEPDFSNAPVNLPSPAPVKKIAYNDPVLPVPNFSAPSSAPAASASDSDNDEIPSVQVPKEDTTSNVKPNETVDYCQKYPESPVCKKPASGKTFCQEWPNSSACSSLKSDSAQPAPIVSAPPVPVSVSSEPVVSTNRPPEPLLSSMPKVDIPNKDADIVLITDQPGAASAEAIKQKFATMAPFSCMNLKVEIYETSKDDLGCNPKIDPKRPRLLDCNFRTRTRANKIRNDFNAKSAIAVVDFDQHGGAAWSRTPIVSSFSVPGAAVNELLYGVGFTSDTYVEGSGPATGGTIMHALDGNIPQAWWPKISKYFNKPAPSACADK